MYNKTIFTAIAAVALLTLACGVSVNFPVDTDIKTGPTEVEEIRVPLLGTNKEISEITLAFGAGELFLSPGAEENLIEGTATYNVFDFRPEIEIEDNRVRISNGNLEINGFPSFNEKLENTWKLDLSSDPINLSIKAGAYKGEFEFGGLNLSGLHITDGAADVDLNFSEANLGRMKNLRYETGASNISLNNLANANFDTLTFHGGAGDYELDFSGQLQEDAEVIIKTGLSSVTISVPEDVNVELTTEGGLSSISARGTWEGSGGKFTQEGDSDMPTLTITVEIGAGNLILRNP